MADEILASCTPEVTIRGGQEAIDGSTALPGKLWGSQAATQRSEGVHGVKVESQPYREARFPTGASTSEAFAGIVRREPVEKAPARAKGHRWDASATSEPLCSCRLCREATADLRREAQRGGQASPGCGEGPPLFGVPFQPYIPRPPGPIRDSQPLPGARDSSGGGVREAEGAKSPSGPDLDAAEINKVIFGRGGSARSAQPQTQEALSQWGHLPKGARCGCAILEHP